MAKRMLIDATHPDETRVVVLNGKTVDEFDYETASKTQIKGNIYLAKVTRVEPSLQAAFIDYGGNRHGFLPFSEIHPDYYRIPIADREALIAEEARLRGEAIEAATDEGEGDGKDDAGEPDDGANAAPAAARASRRGRKADGEDETSAGDGQGIIEEIAQETKVDTVGGEEVEDSARRRAQLLRRYKIQEVIKRRQVMLVQVTKEERGNKGAALTTYLSLAGRYCVLMPNTAKGGGISRKISNAADRRRLKSVVGEMSIPEGMAVIVRTAGSQRTKAEIKRDYEYLLRLWDDIRGKTLQSTAPCLIHEEASLIKRAIRDLYDRDMDEVLVEGADGHKSAKDFMKMLMPSHARKVKPYVDASMPLFHRYQVENQLDAMYSPQVQLRSGGSIVLNPTEALVAIDVNSGRSTRERHIEETALKTNLEAAEEVARQLRLRDLAGLIVIDFIDMEEPRHNREVERRLKEAMKSDRARIQLGRISPFGLLELSRQRLRPSLFETAMVQCHRCNGTGYVRSPDAAALVVLRALTEEGVRKGAGELEIRVPLDVALHVLNEQRPHLAELEQRFGLTALVRADAAMGPADFEIERRSTEALPTQEPRETGAEEAEESTSESRQAREEEETGRRRPRRRRGGRRERDQERVAAAESEQPELAEEELQEEEDEAAPHDRFAEEESEEDRKGKRRRRGRRGGRRRSRRRREDETPESRLADDAEGAGSSESRDLESDQGGFGDVREAREEVETERAEAPAAAAIAPESRIETAESHGAESHEAVPSEAAAPESVSSEADAPARQDEPATVAAEAAEEPQPAKRTRRSRTRKSAAAKDESKGETVSADSAARDETATEAAAEEEQPKKPTRRRRKTATADEPAKAKPAAKKTATRTRRSKAKAEAETATAPEAMTETAAEAPSAAAETVRDEDAAGSKVTNGGTQPAQPSDAGTPAAQEETPPAPSAAQREEPAQESRPRRKGWWNRLIS